MGILPPLYKQRLSIAQFCRNYEESTITDIFNKYALPGQLRARMSKAMEELVDAVCEFFTPDGGYIGLMDSNTSLKYHPVAECLSLYSLKMSATVLKKWSNEKPLIGQGELLPFDVDMSNSRMRQKCFTTTRIKAAQVPLHTY
jgi:hypothetical protein